MQVQRTKAEAEAGQVLMGLLTIEAVQVAQA